MLTFRSSKIVYYGPHGCQNCGQMIVKMGHEFGGNTFNQPEGPIYPNTEWFPHVCDPKRIKPSPYVGPFVGQGGCQAPLRQGSLPGGILAENEIISAQSPE